jgi:hypothetical protein
VIRPSLIFLGFLVGIGLGVLYGWVVSPVKYTDTAPDSLRADYKEQYLIVIASAYKADGDLDRASLRLSRLKESDPIQTITALAQRLAAEGRNEAGDLAALAADLSGGLQPVATVTQNQFATTEPFIPTDTVPPPTLTLSPPTFVVPTATASPQPEFDYEVVTRENYCNDEEREPLIIVDVIDTDSTPLPGVHVIVRWAEGEDGFVTGLKPEISPSYGDFRMKVGTSYTVQVGSRTPPVTGLTAPICTSADDSDQYPGAVRLVFQRK